MASIHLPIRQLVEFLLRTGSIDSRFTGFDRALEGARLHRKLQRAAVKEFPDYDVPTEEKVAAAKKAKAEKEAEAESSGNDGGNSENN